MNTFEDTDYSSSANAERQSDSDGYLSVYDSDNLWNHTAVDIGCSHLQENRKLFEPLHVQDEEEPPRRSTIYKPTIAVAGNLLTGKSVMGKVPKRFRKGRHGFGADICYIVRIILQIWYMHKL